MDACVWNKIVKGNQVTVVIYVDDLMISSKSQEEVHKVRDLIEKEFIEIKTKEGNEYSYLGMLLKKRDDGSIEINMKSYIESTLKEWQEGSYYEYAIPADAKLNYVDPESPPSQKKDLFHRLVAKLLYLSKRGRPDIALAVNYLCTKVKAPTVQDEVKLTRVLGYLQSSIDKVRIITKDGNGLTKMTAYIDAAFAAHEDGKGQSGGAIFIGTTLVDVITRKQKCASRDSTEAELIALSDLVTDVEWHYEWFESQGYKLEIPIIFQDNTSTITLVTSQTSGKMRNKHLRAQRAAIFEGYERKDYVFAYISTEEMIADVLTKPLEGMKYHKFSKVLLGSTINKLSQTKTTGVRCGNRACELGSSCGCGRYKPS